MRMRAARSEVLRLRQAGDTAGARKVMQDLLAVEGVPRYRELAETALPASPSRSSPSLLSTNAARKPATVMRPVRSWAPSVASGIIVSASMARMAPAATAVVPATTSGANPHKPAWSQSGIPIPDFSAPGPSSASPCWPACPARCVCAWAAS
ncbi:DUSAM domain-containing protein [Corallococcus sp. AS-1-6]|nr:DUSAM domain-containing protein [Corallococcus sp. AS-1-6]